MSLASFFFGGKGSIQGGKERKRKKKKKREKKKFPFSDHSSSYPPTTYSGLIVAPMTGPHLDRFNLPQMVTDNQESHCTAFTISCDYAVGTTTGISAHDRALTCRKLADPRATAADFRRPGHMFPLRAVDDGVLARQGHTEAAIEFCKFAGKTPVSAICELVREDDGLMMRRDDCLAFAKRHALRVCTIEALVEYIKKRKGEKNVLV